MKKLIYTSARGKRIVFDDWTHGNYDNGNGVEWWTWVGMCKHCHNKYRGILGSRVDNCGSGICSVDGCENEADYYVDFSADEVEEANE